jgi:hypothetical protein
VVGGGMNMSATQPRHCEGGQTLETYCSQI